MRNIKKHLSMAMALLLSITMVLGDISPVFAAKTVDEPVIQKEQIKKTQREKTELIIKFKSDEEPPAAIANESKMDPFLPYPIEPVLGENGSIIESANAAPMSESDVLTKVKKKLKLKKLKLKDEDSGFFSILGNAFGRKDPSAKLSGRYKVVEIDQSDSMESVVQELRSFSEVEFVQPNYLLSRMDTVPVEEPAPTAPDPTEPVITEPITSEPAATDNTAAPAAEAPVQGEEPASENPVVEPVTEPGAESAPAVTTPTEAVVPAEVLAVAPEAAVQGILDLLFSQQWGHYNFGQSVKGTEGLSGTDINLLKAWEQSKGSADMLVGVLDTGIDVNHEDLISNVFSNPSEIAGNGVDDDDNGYVDDVNGWDFAGKDNSVYDESTADAHGTQIAGIIAAKQNDIGVVGVAPDVKILPLKFMNGGEGYTSDAIEAIAYAQSLGVEVINCSFGSNQYNYALADAMESSDILFVCAAGNDGADADNVPVYPANFNLGNVISIAAIDNTGELAGFSNYGRSIHVAAPGVEIITTAPDNQYDYINGTSAAAAYVSGVAALVESVKDGVTAKQLRQHLITQVNALDSLEGKVMTSGLIDAYQAMTTEVAPVAEPVNSLDIINSILGSVSKISELDDTQLQTLAALFDNDKAGLQALDSYGYPMGDLIQILLEISRNHMSLTSASAILDAIGDAKLSAKRLQEYRAAVLYKNLAFQNEDQLIQYVSGDDDLLQISKALIVANALELDLNNVFRASGSASSIDIQDSAFYELTEDYCADGTALISYQAETGMTWAEIINQVYEYQESLASRVDSLSALYSRYGVNYQNFINTPFDIKQSTNESISALNGELNLNLPLFNIKGKTKDMSVGLRYNSGDSVTMRHRPNPFEITGYMILKVLYYYEVKDANGVVINKYNITDYRGPYTPTDFERQRTNIGNAPLPPNCIDRGFGEDMVYTNNEDVTYKSYTNYAYNLGTGWYLTLPSMEKLPSEDLEIGNAYRDVNWIIHQGDGSKMALRQYYTVSSHAERIKLYNKYDAQYTMSIVATSAFTNGQLTSHFALTHIDGSIVYFSADGTLLGIVDAFGNKTTFTHTTIGSGADASVVIKDITDHYGKKTTITYASGTAIITLPDGNTINMVSAGGMLKSLTDQQGRVTTFDSYSTLSGAFQYNKYMIPKTGGGLEATTHPESCAWNLLTKITYPSKASSVFSYTKAKRMNNGTIHCVGADPYEEYYQVTNRYDLNPGDATHNNEVNYAFTDYTGYKSYYQYDDLPWTFTNTTTISNAEGFEQKSTFNYLHLPIAEETRDNGALVKNILREYDIYANPKKEIETRFDNLGNQASAQRLYSYNTYDQLLQYTDETGAVSQYTYQTGNKSLPATEVIPVDTGKNLTIAYTIDAGNKFNRLKSYTVTDADGAGHAVQVETLRNADGTVSSEKTTTDGVLNRQDTFAYAYGVTDSQGRPVNRVTFSTDNVSQDWDAGNTVTRGTQTLTETYEFDANTWNLFTYKDPTGKTQKYQYDKLNRLTRYENFDGTAKTIQYNDTANEVTATDESGLILKKTYDGLGNELKVQAGAAASPDTVTQKTYDAFGKMLTQTDGNGNTTSYQYDVLGRVLKTTHPDATFSQAQYLDGALQVKTTNEEGHTVTDTFDSKGNKIRTEAADGNGNAVVTEYTYNAAAKPKTVKDPMGRTTAYGYDELGRIISVINPKSETTKYGYDFQNNLIRQVYPDGRAATMEYSPVGQLLKDTDIYGKSQYLAYSLDGTVKKMLDRSAQTQNYTYDTKLRVATQAGPDHTFTYHYLANDRIEYVEDTVNGTLRYAYDSDGRLQQKTFPDGKTMEYGYDNAGNLVSQKDPFGLTVTYGYNNQNQISTLTAGGKTFRYDYYADGLMKTLTYPVAGLKTDYSFDQLNRITGVQNTLNGTSVAGYTCSYDLNGNLTGTATPGLTRSFSYDTLNRLTQVDRTEPNSHTGFTYDVLSNRAGASGNIEYLIPTQPGQLTWDSLNRLKTFKDITTNQTSAYKYDYKGLRTQKVTAAGTTNYYTDEAGRVIAEADGAGNAKAQIIWSNKPLARIVGGVWYYYVYNDHGDVVKLVDDSGTAVNSYSYDEWGNLTEKTEAVENPIRYAGEYQDEESGYYYLRARYYDPVTSRFISKDSKPGTLENPLSQNLYTYCENKPNTNVDPSGHEIEGVQKGYTFMEQIYKQYPGFAKNTGWYNTSYGIRIPDFVNMKVIGEIKNVRYQYLSSQLKGFMQIAQEEGKQLVLVISEGTRLSRPLLKYIRDGRIVLIRVTESLGKGVKIMPLIIPKDLINKYKINTTPIS